MKTKVCVQILIYGDFEIPQMPVSEPLFNVHMLIYGYS